MTPLYSFVVLTYLIFAISCNDSDNFDTVRQKQASMMKSFMNEEIDPCDDFYKYACGNWAKQQNIKESDLRFSIADVLEAKVNAFFKQAILYNNYTSESRMNQISKILEISEVETIRKYYFQCREQKGRKYEPYLSALNIPGGWPALNSSWTSEHFDWLNVTAQLKLMGAASIIDAFVARRFDNASRNTIYLQPPHFPIIQPSALLDDRNNITRNITSREINSALTSLGVSDTEIVKISKNVFEFEIQLASIYPLDNDTESEVVDISLETLQQLMPELNFNRFLNIVSDEEFSDSQEVTLLSRSYFVEVIKLLNKTKPDILANYLLYKLTIPIAYATDNEPHCTSEVIEKMGHLMGYIYDLVFNDDRANADVTEIAEIIKEVFIKSVNKTDWMDDGTKDEALTKLNNLLFKIGSFSDDTTLKVIKDEFSRLDLNSDDYYRNYVKLQAFTVRELFRKLRKFNKRSDADTNSATVNAYYDKGKHQMEIPNSFLQVPIYDYHFPYSIKFGGLGGVLGHEMAHSLDATGRLIDSIGYLRDWWSTESDEQYKNRSSCLEMQYDRYENSVNETLNTTKSDTLDENIADNGGLQHAYRAYELWSEKHSLMNETFTQLNLTARQLFFVSYAQFFCEMAKPELQIMEMLSDEHSLNRIRVVGSLSNFKEFSRQFNCPIGTEMNPAKKCKIW